MSLLIVFSGMDGAGKSTQIELLKKELNFRGDKVVRIWARGGYTPLFNSLKWVMRKLAFGKLPGSGSSSQRDAMFKSTRNSKIWLTFAIFDLFLFYALWVRVLMLCGYSVLSDRYIGDTKLDFCRNFPGLDVQSWYLWQLLNRLICSPSYKFLFLIEPEESVSRSIRKGEPFPDSLLTLRWRHEAYNQDKIFGSYYLLSGNDSINQVHSQILDIIYS